MSEYRELLLGCGHRRDKRINHLGPDRFLNLTTVDINPACKPDIVYDLREWTWDIGADDFFDEIHAYEVLEHVGQQGDYRKFFSDFSNIWRLLKPNGLLIATVPSRYSEALWGDPGHTRAILPLSLVFLDQTQYIKQLDAHATDKRSPETAMSDYRDIYRADFSVEQRNDNHSSFFFVLRAVKPSRYRERT